MTSSRFLDITRLYLPSLISPIPSVSFSFNAQSSAQKKRRARNYPARNRFLTKTPRPTTRCMQQHPAPGGEPSCATMYAAFFQPCNCMRSPAYPATHVQRTHNRKNCRRAFALARPRSPRITTPAYTRANGGAACGNAGIYRIVRVSIQIFRRIGKFNFLQK